MKLEKAKILWLDNDPGYLVGPVLALRRGGTQVTVVRSVTEAETQLEKHVFDLLILDVMIPVTASESDRGYTVDVTDSCHTTGLEFYRRHGKSIEENNLILVMTVRVDKDIKEKFLNAGLPAECFLTKIDLANAKVFMARIQNHLKEIG